MRDSNQQQSVTPDNISTLMKIQSGKCMQGFESEMEANR